MSKPRRIVMLAFPDCQLLDVTGPLQILAGANDELGRPAYALTLAAPRRGPFRTSSGLKLVADCAIGEVDPARFSASDTVMVAGGDKGVRAALKDGAIAALLAAAGRRGSRLVSVCSGTFFLAAAGVLDGRRAATHWDAVERLRRFRPAIDVDGEAIYVKDGNVWSSAGVTAGIDLALALVEADFGRAVALAIARRHVVFRIRPGGQAQFSPELAAQGARDTRLSRLAEKIAEAPRGDWRLETLSSEAGLAPRTLSRLFRRELNTSPAAFVERVRIDQARRTLISTGAPIETVARQCGFGSLRRMDRAFARAIAASPKEFRARFKSTGVSP
jgi:transcriptional regulator GlxA family with amidase domain